MPIDPVSTSLGVAPLATTALAKLRTHDPVINLFRELRSGLAADARIPAAVREQVAATVAGNAVPWKADAGLAIDPYFMSCVQRVLDDGNRAALDAMRGVLRARLLLDDPNVDVDAIIEVVIDIVDRSVGPAQSSLRTALHHEARRFRQEITALRADVPEPPTKYFFIDVMRAPDSVRRALTELGHAAPAEAAWLQARFGDEQPGQVAAKLVANPPPEVRLGSAAMWACIARYAEDAGEWMTATEAWLRASAAPQGDQVAALVSAAIAAYVAGDADRYRGLVDGAEAIDPGHPRVRLERAGRISDPQQRLVALAPLSFDFADFRAILACLRALACLQLGRVDEARTHSTEAVAECNALLQVRMTRLNVEVETARTAIRAGRDPDAIQMLRIERGAAEIRARLTEQRRWQESAAALMLACDAIFLSGDVQRAISTAEQASVEELAMSDGREVILELASRIGAHSLVLRLLPQPVSDDDCRIHAAALAFAGTDSQQRDAVSTLERLAALTGDVGEHAALTRVLLAVLLPRFGWSMSCADRLLGTEHEDFAVSANAVWLAGQRRWDEAERLLSRYPQEETWVIQARFDAMQSHPNAGIRRAAATRLLREAPDPSTRLSCGVVLWCAGDPDRGEAEVRAVATNINAPRYPRSAAYRFLVVSAIEVHDGRGALRILDAWDRLDPGSTDASALRVRASTLLRRRDTE